MEQHETRHATPVGELLKQVRHIEIRSRRAVNSLLGGEYHSVFRGRGMEFDEVREYAPGDEIRDIDWNVTARAGKPFIKRYVEEREQTVFLLVDISASGTFGSRRKLKEEIAAEVCAVLAFSAISNKDRVGMIRFSDRIEEVIPPRRGRKHVLRVVRQILFDQPEGIGTDYLLAVDMLNRILKRRAIIFIISDFLGPNLKQALMRIDKHHDVTAVMVNDPREASLPSAGFMELQDPETGQLLLVNTQSSRLRESYAATWRIHRAEIQKIFAGRNMDVIQIDTDAPYMDALVRSFRKRAKRR